MSDTGPECINCGHLIDHDEAFLFVRWRWEDPTNPPEHLITTRGEATYCGECKPPGIPHPK